MAEILYKVWHDGMPMFTSNDFIECVDKCKANQWDYVEAFGKIVYPSEPHMPKKEKKESQPKKRSNGKRITISIEDLR